MTSRQYFDGFHATSQFWRIHILRNHGSTKTAICNMKLFGVDALLAKWFSECGCTPVSKGSGVGRGRATTVLPPKAGSERPNGV